MTVDPDVMGRLRRLATWYLEANEIDRIAFASEMAYWIMEITRDITYTALTEGAHP